MEDSKLHINDGTQGTPKENNPKGENPELFDVLNPYNPTTPAGKICFDLYAKASKENKEKLRANIKINNSGNVETMGREFFALNAEPNGIDILERNGIIFFLGDAAEREAIKIGCKLFTTDKQAYKFIKQFVGRDDELRFKITNIMGIFGFAGTGAKNQQGGHYKTSSKERVPSFKAYFVALTKPYKYDPKKEDTDDEDRYDLNTFGIRSAKIDGEINASTDIFNAKDGYPYIVSRPIQK